ncbi:hypothetical protein B0J12DRAFT_370540 [Macrophomina phaseolina]|uniref:Uncharacterized protein n=1 Tax=Macrophomina phaseolina TaxID=35725 RepID=A0ABQ8GMH3_9PEZI|nr:hypothetical protein B0J12DRAFT_370540 [Macrophomina phaseolina]
MSLYLATYVPQLVYLFLRILTFFYLSAQNICTGGIFFSNAAKKKKPGVRSRRDSFSSIIVLRLSYLASFYYSTVFLVRKRDLDVYLLAIVAHFIRIQGSE